MKVRWDVIVVGAGASGLMAAGRAAMLGASVLLLEKMDRPGRKLRLTGKGRCNVTNVAPVEEFLGHFYPDGRFLRNVFARFFAPDLRALLDEVGVPTKVERGGRVFPVSDRAQDVVEGLLRWGRSAGVVLRCFSPVRSIWVEGGRVRGVRTARGEIASEAVVLCTGGASYPSTGSTGDGYRMAREVGHTVRPIYPALVPLITRGDLAGRLEGLTLRNVGVRLVVDGEVAEEQTGDLLFTRDGISGPTVLTLSGRAVEALLAGRKVKAVIDMKPGRTAEEIDERLRGLFDRHGKRSLQRLVAELLPRRLGEVLLDALGMPGDRVANQVSREERGRLVEGIKAFALEVEGHRPLREAVVTAGGVVLKEVDPRTMESRLVRGLYLAGELLDVYADTGGFNLQAAFSTGWVAGEAAALKLKG